MAYIDPFLSTTPVARIAGPHQSTVATILRAVKLGLFTAPQAELMIDRVRAHLTAPPVTSPTRAPGASLSFAADGFPAAVNGLASGTLPDDPDRTFR